MNNNRKSGSGRPVDTVKIAHIIATARDIFFQNGFALSSIESIAIAACVSKVTIYNHFKTKEALFAASVEAECDTMRDGLSIDINPNDDIREQLQRFSMNMLSFLARQDIIRVESHLAVEAEHNPELGRLFLESGPRRLQSFLIQLLDNAVAKGELNIENNEIAAGYFIGMVKGADDMDRRFWQKPYDNQQALKHVDGAVELFLAAYRTNSVI